MIRLHRKPQQAHVLTTRLVQILANRQLAKTRHVVGLDGLRHFKHAAVKKLLGICGFENLAHSLNLHYPGKRTDSQQ